jgi:hypothetical protein
MLRPIIDRLLYILLYECRFLHLFSTSCNKNTVVYALPGKKRVNDVIECASFSNGESSAYQFGEHEDPML